MYGMGAATLRPCSVYSRTGFLVIFARLCSRWALCQLETKDYKEIWDYNVASSDCQM